MSATGWDHAQRIARDYGTAFSPRPEPDDGAHCALIALPPERAAELVDTLTAIGCAAYTLDANLGGGTFVFLTEY